MARVLLTGATGFVGHHILRVLQQRGHEVILPVRPGWRDRIAPDPAPLRVIESADLFVEDHAWWCDALRGADLVIHTAWCAEPGSYLTSGENLTCLGGSLRMARAASEVGVARVVGLGTCIEYGMSDAPLDIDAPLAPTTPYAGAKVAAYHALGQWFAHAGVSFLWCRLFHLHGPGEHPRRLMPMIHASLRAGTPVDLTSGQQIRDFIAVEVAARRIVDGALSAVEGPANICTGQGRTVRALAEEIADGYGRRDLLNFGARANNLVDPPCIVGVPTVFGA